MHIVVAGASGLIGTALRASLVAHGHDVTQLVRREPQGPDQSRWDPEAGTVDHGLIASADVVVNLAGASIGDKRLTESYARVVLTSRTDTTSLLAGSLAKAGGGNLIQGSSMGFYGDRGEEHLTERSEPGDTQLARITRLWEQSADAAIEAGVRVAFSRTGLVLAPHGGFAARLLPLVKRGLLRSLGPGTAYHSWITLEDAVGALRWMIEGTHEGPVNVVSPNPARDRELIAALSRAAGKRPGLPVPAWVLRIVEGPAVEDLLSSQYGVPGVLDRSGFAWQHAALPEAAAWVMTPVAP